MEWSGDSRTSIRKATSRQLLPVYLGGVEEQHIPQAQNEGAQTIELVS